MSVVYVRNKDGNFVPIHTIRGNTGPMGKPPVKGEDYFTASDQKAMLDELGVKSEAYIDAQLGISVDEIDALIGGDA